MASRRHAAVAGSSSRVRQPAMVVIWALVRAFRASTPRSTLRTSAVTALMILVRSVPI
jgi:hypothetical protein